ncbi:sugar transferase [Celeribacter sp.]|uniref:sugar transferase n=1 Tax=Celeribacter sp. TaxID=1890673 RepID=UPI003A8DC36A
MSFDATKLSAHSSVARKAGKARLVRINRGAQRPREISKTLYARNFKRAFDIAFSLLILPIVAPVLLVLFVLVRAEGAPAIFAHERVGKGNKRFKCYKLRTMKVDADQILKDLCASDPKIAAEWHRYQKLENDPRITKLGRFLRATSLDELPQIWNVLLGDMSVVGPRPYTPDQEDLYENAGGWAYAQLRPGITGLWQIEGRNATTFGDRARYDNLYGRTCSFINDLGLILRTVTVIFARTGS